MFKKLIFIFIFGGYFITDWANLCFEEVHHLKKAFNICFERNYLLKLSIEKTLNYGQHFWISQNWIDMLYRISEFFVWGNLFFPVRHLNKQINNNKKWDDLFNPELLDDKLELNNAILDFHKLITKYL